MIFFSPCVFIQVHTNMHRTKNSEYLNMMHVLRKNHLGQRKKKIREIYEISFYFLPTYKRV